MIITDKSRCCGCNACVQRCPKQCITMHEDEEGFLYPKVEQSICIDCGLCEKVCPIINPNRQRKPLQVFAAKNKNEEQRLRSSSGGIFILLAEYIIKQGGVVFGARFDKNWEVEHVCAETIEDLRPLMRSKYVQSRIGNTYKEAEQFLKDGRKVLFTGTPCQIAAFKLFLRKEYENLLTVDIICHGVPSPMVWRKYLENKTNQQGIESIQSISFRDKGTGWKNYSFNIRYKNGYSECLFSEYASKNVFMKGFLANLYLRPSCYACPSKKLRSGSDITIGDFWGIQYIKPELDDDKGISCVLINTTKGDLYFKLLSLARIEFTYDDVLKGNISINESAKISNDKRDKFFRLYDSLGISSTLLPLLRIPFWILFRRKVFQIYNKFFSFITNLSKL